MWSSAHADIAISYDDQAEEVLDMTPFVTEVRGCACPRCIAFATPVILPPIAAPVAVGAGATTITVPDAAPHEFWDRVTPPPIEGFVEGRFVTEPVVTPPREVQIVPVGTPLAEVIGLPGNPFLD